MAFSSMKSCTVPRYRAEVTGTPASVSLCAYASPSSRRTSSSAVTRSAGSRLQAAMDRAPSIRRSLPGTGSRRTPPRSPSDSVPRETACSSRTRPQRGPRRRSRGSTGRECPGSPGPSRRRGSTSGSAGDSRHPPWRELRDTTAYRWAAPLARRALRGTPSSSANRRIVVGRHALRTPSFLLLRLHAALHLLGRDVLDVRADRPRVAPPVGDGRHAIAVELVRRLAPRLPARRQRLLVGGVHVGHVEIGADPRRWVFGVGVGEHQHGVSHAYFGMADLSARSGKAIHLVAAERLLEKVDEVGRALDDEVRRERVVALGNWLDRHGASLSEEAPSYHNRHALAWSVRSSFQNPSRASGSATFPRSDRNR